MPIIPLILLGASAWTHGPDEFGLKPGTERVYQTTTGAEREKLQKSKVVGQTRAQGMDVFDIKMENGRHQFFGVSPEGLFQFYVSDMQGTTLDKDSAPVPVLLKNKRAGQSWEWVEPFRGQTSGGPGAKELDWERLKTHCKATLVSVDEKVTVPAGTFVTWHVTVQRHSEDLGDSRQETWIAPGTGIVKQTSAQGEWKSSTVLVSRE
ncbi:MAG: hypothetical protein JST30_07280 [Armatimonadetes bacterium]|nr:hypothetical protein [Armatimonadota bacterium]